VCQPAERAGQPELASNSLWDAQGHHQSACAPARRGQIVSTCSAAPQLRAPKKLAPLSSKLLFSAWSATARRKSKKFAYSRRPSGRKTSCWTLSCDADRANGPLFSPFLCSRTWSIVCGCVACLVVFFASSAAASCCLWRAWANFLQVCPRE